MPVGPNILWLEKHVEVAVERLHVDGQVRHRLRAVDQHHGAARVRLRDHLAHRIDRARARSRRGRPPRSSCAPTAADRRRRRSTSPRSLIGTTRSDGAGLLAQHLPRHDVRVMLEPRQQHLVARLQRRPPVALRHEVDAVGRALGQDDRRARRRVDERAPPWRARPRTARRALAQQMRGAMDVGVGVAVVVVHRREHRLAASGWCWRCRDRRAACRARARDRIGKSARTFATSKRRGLRLGRHCSGLCYGRRVMVGQVAIELR